MCGVKNRSVLLAITVLAAIANVTAAQRTPVPPPLIGVWHLAGIDHPEDDSPHLHSLELEFTPSGFRTYYRLDLEDPSVCRGTVKLGADNWLVLDTADPADNCDVFDSDVFGTEFLLVSAAQSLELHTAIPNDTDPPMVLRFERGGVQQLTTPRRPSCGDGALPSQARQDGPSFFAFDRRLETSDEMGLKPSERAAGETVRRQWLQRAVNAFEGRAAPVLLKFGFSSVEGDLIETFLDVRRGRADFVHWEEPGLAQSKLLIRCPVSQMLVVEPVSRMLLVPMKPGQSSARARLVLRLDADESERFTFFPRGGI